jgi:hypothetical protein
MEKFQPKQLAQRIEGANKAYLIQYRGGRILKETYNQSNVRIERKFVGWNAGKGVFERADNRQRAQNLQDLFDVIPPSGSIVVVAWS